MFDKMFGIIFADAVSSWSIGFQDPASPWMYAIIDLHDRILLTLIFLFVVVLWFLASATLNTKNISNGN